MERAEGLPPAGGFRVHGLAAGGLVGRPHVLARAAAADGPLAAEAPGAHADPAEIGHRVAPMRQFPVQHGADPVRAEQDIAHAEVAMHQLRRPGFGRGGGQMAEGEVEDRPRLAVFGVPFGQHRERAFRRAGVEPQPRPVDAMDGGEDAPGLGREAGAGLGEVGLAQDAGGQRLAGHAVHDEALAGAVLAPYTYSDATAHAGTFICAHAAAHARTVAGAVVAPDTNAHAVADADALISTHAAAHARTVAGAVLAPDTYSDAAADATADVLTNAAADAGALADALSAADPGALAPAYKRTNNGPIAQADPNAHAATDARTNHVADTRSDSCTDAATIAGPNAGTDFVAFAGADISAFARTHVRAVGGALPRTIRGTDDATDALADARARPPDGVSRLRADAET